ncbi:MAG: hypothetical protein IPP93_17115 [Chitinophagaceae bacterium]|nr:hypothetical protein [Chitinophagaceae bacterium]
MDNSTPDMSQTLVQYLDGELTVEQQAAVEQQLTSQPALQGEYDSLLVTREAIRFAGLQKQVAGIHVTMMKELNTPVKQIRPVRKIFRYSIAVAASLLLIIGGYLAYSFYSLSPNKVFDANYQSYELSTVRDGNNPPGAVEQAYQSKNYKAAIDQGSASTEIKDVFLVAIAAIAGFRKVLEMNKTAGSTIRKDETEYYLALSYLRNRDYDLSLELLRSIHDNPEHTYHGKVNAKMIRQVRWLKWR